MRKTVVRALANFSDAPEYQVELFDHQLVDYFVRHPDSFQAFQKVDEASRNRVWFDSYRASRGLVTQAHA